MVSEGKLGQVENSQGFILVAALISNIERFDPFASPNKKPWLPEQQPGLNNLLPLEKRPRR